MGYMGDADATLQSSLVLRFVNNDFQENKEPTIGGMHARVTTSSLRRKTRG